MRRLVLILLVLALAVVGSAAGASETPVPCRTRIADGTAVTVYAYGGTRQPADRPRIFIVGYCDTATGERLVVEIRVEPQDAHVLGELLSELYP